MTAKLPDPAQEFVSRKLAEAEARLARFRFREPTPDELAVDRMVEAILRRPERERWRRR